MENENCVIVDGTLTTSSPMNKIVLDIETYLMPKPIDMGNKVVTFKKLAPRSKVETKIGLFEEDGEKFYVVFDTKHGDMEFSSIEALSEYLTPTNGGRRSKEDAMINSIVRYKSGFNWVTDNDPVELDYIRWEDREDGSFHGTYVICSPIKP